MADRAGLHLAADTHFTGLFREGPGVLLARGDESALSGQVPAEGAQPVLPEIRLTVGREGRPVVGEIDFAARHSVQEFGVDGLPGLLHAGHRIRCGRHLLVRRHDEELVAGQRVLLRVAEVRREAHIGPGIVERENRVADPLLVVLERRIAVTIQSVEADAERAVLAETPAHVGQRTDLPVGVVARAGRRERLGPGLFRCQVDGAADSPDIAIQKGARSAENLDALERLDGHAIFRHEPIEAVERNAAGTEQEPADSELVEHREPVLRGRRVVGDDIGDGPGLLVLNEGRCVAGAGERRVHDVAVAQEALAATGRNLSAGVGWRQVVDRRLLHQARALHLHGIELPPPQKSAVSERRKVRGVLSDRVVAPPPPPSSWRRAGSRR